VAKGEGKIMPPVTLETTLPLARVRELPAGDSIIGFYLLTKIEVKPKRTGGHYLEVRLQDASGHLVLRMWEGFEEFVAQAKVGDVIKIDAVVDRYRDVPGLVANRLRIATEEEVPDKRAFLPQAGISATEAHRQLFEIIESIQIGSLKQLLLLIFQDAGFLARFLQAAGGKLWHHATVGGLAEHTISMANLADVVAARYPEAERDLIVAGALLHDIGKVFELDAEIAIDYTIEGRLLGHISQGAIFVDRKMSGMADFPVELRRQLLHLILSHQGDGTMGSPVKPMTLEAILLHYCDEMDSKVNAFLHVKEQTPEGRDFSDYVKLMERFFYFRSVNGEEQSNES
jgi:3'-5' exoribonuclease